MGDSGVPDMQRRLGTVPNEPPPYSLVDVHVHVGSSDSDEAYYPTLTGEEYLQHALAAGVQRAYAFPPFRVGGYREANAALRDWAATSQGRMGCFARLGGPQVLHAQFPPHLWQVRRWLRRPRRASDVPTSLDGFDGIKLLPHLDGVPPAHEMRDIHDRALPVLVHGGRYVSPAWIVKHLLPRTAGPLIIAHLGGFPHENRLLEEGLTAAQRHARVYLDTSGIWDVGFIQRAAARVPDKLIFGSDAPLTTPMVAWQHVACAIADDDVLRLLGHDTPVRLGLLLR
ncbi:MAG: amidohydrolase family protein [Ornithinimicrobium sp.]